MTLFALAKHDVPVLSAIHPNPLSASLTLTERCNSRCITCNVWRHESADELSTDEALGLLSSLKDIGVRSVILSGGEILLRRDLPRIVQKASQLGLMTNIQTNGILLTKTIAEDLVRRGLSSIALSIDGLRENNDRIRGINGLFEKNVANIQMLAALRSISPSFQVMIATTLMSPTLEDLRDLILLCRKNGASISFNLIDDHPRLFEGIDLNGLWIKDQATLDRTIRDIHILRAHLPKAFARNQTHVALEYARRYFNDPRQDQVPCVLGYVWTCVDCHGNVYPGCPVLPPVANIRSRSLREIIRSSEYTNMIRSMFRKECPGCSCGYPTNLMFDISSLAREIAWRLVY
jgi:MoaA/NifB/PqqE/SkfB family radical SAM enzyme